MEKESWPVPGNSLNHSTSATEVNRLSDFYQEVFRRLEHQEEALRGDAGKVASLDPGGISSNLNPKSYRKVDLGGLSEAKNPTRMRKYNGPDKTVPTQPSELADKATPPSEPGYLYLVRALGTDRFHIGLTNQIERRFDDLQRNSPFPLKLIISAYSPNPQAQELRLHKLFGQWRLHGEWFELPPEVLNRVVEEFKEILDSALVGSLRRSGLTLEATEPSSSRLQESSSHEITDSGIDTRKRVAKIGVGAQDNRKLSWLPLKTIFVAEALERHGFVLANNAGNYCMGSEVTRCCGWELSWLLDKPFLSAFYDGALWLKPMEELLSEADFKVELRRVRDLILQSCKEFDRLRAESNSFYSL